MFNKDTFCILPWSSIQINPSGDFKVCCFSGVTSDNKNGNNHGMCLDESGNVMSIFTHSIQDALNSKYHRELRLTQSTGKRHPVCKVCWDRDDANTKMGQMTNSLRYFRTFIQLPNLDNAIPLEKAESMMDTYGYLQEEPISLDLRFTNVCNMKCIMCDSKYSNQWYKDEVALYGKPFFNVDSKIYNIKVDNGVYKSDMPVWHDSPIWWEKFDAIKHRVRHIYLTGGEPFIMKGHDTLLDKLIEAGISDKIILEYDTNLTVINDKILDRLKQFKQVILSVSCDDVEDKFELIRFGGKFTTMLNNLQKLKERNIKIRHLSSCTGIYSLYSPIRLYNYFLPLGYDTFSFRFLRSPFHSDIAFLPDHLKERMIDVYSKSNLPDKWKNFYIGYFRNNIGIHSKEECDTRMLTHIKYLNDLDALRGTNWKTVLPEIAELLKEYI